MFKTWKKVVFIYIKSMFFKISVILVIIGCGKKGNVRFLVWCAGVAICVRFLVVYGCLWSFASGWWWLVIVCWWFVVVCGHLLVVCGRLRLFAGGLWSFAGGLLSLVTVACFSKYDFRNKRFFFKRQFLLVSLLSFCSRVFDFLNIEYTRRF